MLIIHGDNIIQSRQKLKEVLDQARQTGLEIIRVEAKNLTEAALEELLGATDLFGTGNFIIIEGLHSLPRSKKKDALIERVASHQTDNLVLWEKRSLTKTMLKKFPQAKTEEFKSSSATFKWLELLGTPKQKQKLELLHQGIAADSDYFCFIMLIRQIGLLIQVKDGGKIAGPPFVVQKIKSQAAKLTLAQLLEVHEKLYRLDLRQKTSKSPLNLAQELDLITLSL